MNRSESRGGEGTTSCDGRLCWPARPPASLSSLLLALTSADEMFPARAPELVDGDAPNVAEPQTSLTTPTLGCLRADPSSCQSQLASPLPPALPLPHPPTHLHHPPPTSSPRLAVKDGLILDLQSKNKRCAFALGWKPCTGCALYNIWL